MNSLAGNIAIKFSGYVSDKEYKKADNISTGAATEEGSKEKSKGNAACKKQKKENHYNINSLVLDNVGKDNCDPATG